MKKSRFKALALFSGGLDSILAVKIIQLQQIAVEGIVFLSTFFNHKSTQDRADRLNIKLHFFDITEDLIRIIENPKYGFGKNLNPCIDCHLYMIKRTGHLLKELNADFIITGEVVGERPKSQNYKALSIIAEESGYATLLLRPLSAGKLPVTDVEQKGIVNREKLYDFTGRCRKPQMALAKKFNIDYYPSSAGGCLLTVPDFSDRLRYNLKMKKLSREDLELLKCGRHFLTQKQVKIIIGRNEEDNNKILDSMDHDYYIIELEDMPGPVGIICEREPDIEDILRTASLAARYSKLREKEKVKVNYYKKKGEIHSVRVKPKDYKELDLILI